MMIVRVTVPARILTATIVLIAAAVAVCAQDAAAIDRAVKALDLIRPTGAPRPRDFTLPLTNGEPFRLIEHRGTVVLVNFWATWCEPCKREMPELERLWRDRRERGLLVLAVSVDTDSTVVAPFLAKQKFTFPVALDPRGEVGKQFGARALPTTSILGPDGALAAFAYGPRRWDGKASLDLIDALRARSP